MRFSYVLIDKGAIFPEYPHGWKKIFNDNLEVILIEIWISLCMKIFLTIIFDLLVRWTLYLKYKEFLEDWILHKYPHNYTYHFLNRLMLSRILNCCHLLAKLMLPSGSRSWLPMLMKVRSCRIRPLWEREKKNSSTFSNQARLSKKKEAEEKCSQFQWLK